MVNPSGESALAAAAYAGHFEIMWRLHAAGAPLDEPSEMGGNALFSAVYFGNDDEVMPPREAGRATAMLTAASPPCDRR